MNNKSLKYWILLFTQCLMIGSSVGLAINSVGVFYSSVTSSLNVLHGSFALHGTIQLITTGIISLFIPRLLKKYDYKLIILIGGLGSFLSTFLMGLSNNLTNFYILGFLRGISVSLCGGVPMSFLINNWFYKFRGTALSIAFSFSGLAGALFSPILTELIKIYGWQTTYMIKSVIMFLLVLPAVIYPYKLYPSTEGLLPFGYENTQESEAIKQNEKFNYINMYLFLFLIFALINTTITGLPQHFINYAKSISLDSSIGAAMLSYAMIGNISFKLIIGFLNDTIGAFKSVLIMIATNIIAIISIVFLKQYYLGAFLLGTVYAIGAVGLPLLSTEFFSKENYMYVFPLASFSGTCGSAIALSLIGFLFDFTHSYFLAYLIAIGINIINISIILFIAKNKQNIIKI